MKSARVPFVAGLLFCLLACDLLADTPQIRVSIEATAKNDDDAKMISALSHEFRKLDGVQVTDTQPALQISCSILRPKQEACRGYIGSYAVTDADGRLVAHNVLIAHDIDTLAHNIATSVDGYAIEQMRRKAQPSSSP